MAIEFHPLRVQVRPETDDSVVVSLAVPDHLRDAFCHIPGQHVVLRAMIDGDDVRRSYSICSVPGQPTLQVGIKRIAGGAFSTWATTELASGDLIEVMPPIGEFCHRPDLGSSGRYVALAAGSGITPVLSILTAILEGEPTSQCTLVYGNRYVRSIMFLEELEALKDRFCERFQLIHVLSREPHEIPLFQGRIDGDKLRLLAKTLIPVEAVDTWFCCGPLDLVETAQTTLGELGVDESRIRSELFYDQRIPPVPATAVPGDGQVELTLTLDGRTSVVAIDPDGPSLLDYARTVRPEAPFACKGGMCATCKARVLSGQVTMAKNYALTDAEIGEGFILSCQSHPVAGSNVTISYDVHGGLGR